VTKQIIIENCCKLSQYKLSTYLVAIFVMNKRKGDWDDLLLNQIYHQKLFDFRRFC
jgi:hypothetical protein